MLRYSPPIQPMLAKPAKKTLQELANTPESSDDLSFEPKWDGFRCLIFRNGSDVIVQGRSGDDLAYCFPEIVVACQSLPDPIILDGELIILQNGRLQFELLGQRIRPRSEAGGWKIQELASAHPAQFVAFDVLQTGDTGLMEEPYTTRRLHLEAVDLLPPFHLTPATQDLTTATDWFTQLEGAGLDGVIGKPRSETYQPGRRALLKFKHVRTADVVVAGWRAHKSPGTSGRAVVGSLLLGLFDSSGTLHHVGVASSFSAAKREELTDFLAPYVSGPGEPHPWSAHSSGETGEARRPGGLSRWSGGKDLSFHLVRPELVAEVKYDHMEGPRFRHVTRLLRFRPDREPSSCTFDQLDSPDDLPISEFIPSLVE